MIPNRNRAESAEYRRLWRMLVAALVLLAAPVALAQLATGDDPEAVADRAVEAWLEQQTRTIGALMSLPPEEACRDLPALVENPPPPEGTEVNLEDRQQRQIDVENARSYTYPAELPNGELDVVQVDLSLENGTWSATSVGFRAQQGPSRSFLNQPLAWAAFLLLSLATLYLLFRQASFLRAWVREGRALLREHRGIFIGTMVLVYGAFALGAISGTALPEACAEAVLSVLQGSLEATGATQAVESGNILRAALTIWYQNFVVVNVVVFFTLAVLFGIPGYLGAAVILFVNGIPFGLVGSFGLVQLVFLALLIFLELTAHAVVVAGGGIMLKTVIRGGFSAFSEGVRRLVLMIPLAFLLLLIGAWYETFLLVPGM